MPPAEPPVASDPAAAAQASCWECQRRHWDCDAARPVCNRCRDNGIVCPGYNDCKPLTWLAPGRVSARSRRQRGSKAQIFTATPTIRTKPVDANAAIPATVPVFAPVSTPARPPPRATSEHHVRSGSVPSKAQRKDHGGKVASGAIILRPRQHAQGVVRRQNQHVGQVPRLLHNPLAEMDEAATYFNSEIYPYLAEHQLAPNPFVAPIFNIGLFPPSMRHGLISLALGHRVLQLTIKDRNDTGPTKALSMFGTISGPMPGPNSGAAGGLWLRIHDHVWSAIRALNEEISQVTTQTASLTMVSVFVFLIADLFQSALPRWRSHSDGFSALLKLRGGIQTLANDPVEGPLLRPGLLTFVIMSVMANTTSPSCDIASAAEHFSIISTIEDLYACGLYPRLPCPAPLFLEVIRINDLRHRVAVGLEEYGATNIKSAVLERFHSLIDFSCSDWADQQATSTAVRSECPQETWLLIAEAFQSAVLLFAESSLTSLLPVCTCISLGVVKCDSCGARLDEVVRSFHRTRLLRLVEECLASHLTMYCVIWPLIVAGFEANHGTPEEQAMVKRGLTNLSLQAGATTMVARNVLREFWASGKMSWDECFDQPYAFLV